MYSKGKFHLSFFSNLLIFNLPIKNCRYYRDPELTRQTLDDQGWHHTGDIGQWLPNGTLKIIDRKKHIFKLSQGEYIVPEKIENVYIRSQYIEQVFVHGESLKVNFEAIKKKNFKN